MVTALATASVVAGCVTTEQLAPLVGPAHFSAAEAMGVQIEQVQRGRLIYLNQCVECHAPEPVDGYTVKQWAKIMPEMAEDSGLSPQQERAVHQYVLTTLRALRSPTP